MKIVCKASQAMLRIFLATKRYSCIRGRFALVGLQCSGSVLCDSHMLVALEDAIQVYTIYKLRRFSSAKFRSELELRTVRQYEEKKQGLLYKGNPMNWSKAMQSSTFKTHLYHKSGLF